MLHVTNGSVALSRLHDLGLPGECIPWDDVLHEGPVPEGLTEDQLRHLRAEFLGDDWNDVASVERSLRARDETLAAAAAGDDEIVLWFEHDLYDQLHVLQVLDRLDRPGRPRRSNVSAILADDYLAAQPESQLRAWFESRPPVSDAQWDAAVAAWAAFRAPTPEAIAAFAHPGAWPALKVAFRRHLQQFPSIEHGLSRTEMQTLNAVAEAPLSLRAAFRASNEVEPAIFMGDLGWWFHIRRLITGPRPLLQVVGDPPPDFNHPEWWRDDDGAPRLALTETGARVLAGEADYIALNGIDRWLGGVHLVASPPSAGERQPIWRWDEAHGRVVRSEY